VGLNTQAKQKKTRKIFLPGKFQNSATFSKILASKTVSLLMKILVITAKSQKILKYMTFCIISSGLKLDIVAYQKGMNYW